MAAILEYPLAAWNFLEKLESNFDEKEAVKWMKRFRGWSFIISFLYVALVLLGRKWMENRKPVMLRTALCMWSTALAVFSIYASIKIIPIMYDELTVAGFEYSLCELNFYLGSTKRGLWAFLFPFSKLLELIDTAFIVLRKSKISFLHCYHHATVFIFCWYSYANPSSPAVWGRTVNFFVHAVMYTYYAIKASGRYPPRAIAQAITTLQLSQMFFGLYYTYTAIKCYYSGRVCGVSTQFVVLSIFLFGSYALLFMNFYYWTYIHSKGGRRGVQFRSIAGKKEQAEQDDATASVTKDEKSGLRQR